MHSSEAFILLKFKFQSYNTIENTNVTTVVPTKSDSDTILCLQLLSKTVVLYVVKYTPSQKLRMSQFFSNRYRILTEFTEGIRAMFISCQYLFRLKRTLPSASKLCL